GATNGHQRSTLLPAKPAAPSNLPHLHRRIRRKFDKNRQNPLNFKEFKNINYDFIINNKTSARK
ncbi:hypothetical protein ACC699_30905, partial [Rhizobium ruizarguesonis]